MQTLKGLKILLRHKHDDIIFFVNYHLNKTTIKLYFIFSIYMELKCFPLMGTPCKRLMQRRNYRIGKKAGQRYRYRPQQRHINRLARELNMNPDDVRKQIASERLYLLRQIYGETEITPADV